MPKKKLPLKSVKIMVVDSGAGGLFTKKPWFTLMVIRRYTDGKDHQTETENINVMKGDSIGLWKVS